jgi:hypothetical protein
LGTVNSYFQSQNNYANGFNTNKRGNTSDIDGSVASGAELGYNGFYGWDGTNYGRGAYIIAKTTENWNTTNHGAQLQFTTTPNGGTTQTYRMVILNNGYIGIGTITPTSLLMIQGSTASVPLLNLYSTTGGADVFTLSTNYANGNNISINPYIKGVNNGGFEIRNSTANLFTISPTGNIGIKTTSPGYPLHVNGSASGITAYFENNVSAEDYLYHSPFTESTKEDALDSILKIEGASGKINHSTIPSDALSYQEKPIYEIGVNEEGIEDLNNKTQIGVEQEPQTSVGVLLSYLILSTQKLFDLNEDQEEIINNLENEVITLKGENEIIKLAFCKEFPENSICNGK